MKLEKKLLSNGFLNGGPGIVPNTAGMAVASDIDDDVETTLMKPAVLQDWAELLADIEGPVEVAIRECERSDRDDTDLMLVAQVPDTNVVVGAAPFIRNDDLYDDSEDEEELDDEESEDESDEDEAGKFDVEAKCPFCDETLTASNDDEDEDDVTDDEQGYPTKRPAGEE